MGCCSQAYDWDSAGDFLLVNQLLGHELLVPRSHIVLGTLPPVLESQHKAAGWLQPQVIFQRPQEQNIKLWKMGNVTE